jgi:hypothetical protein
MSGRAAPNRTYGFDRRGQRPSERGLARTGRDPGLPHGFLAAAWYCSTTLAGMRPQSLTAMPWSYAHAGYHRCAHGLPPYARVGGAVPSATVSFAPSRPP